MMRMMILVPLAAILISCGTLAKTDYPKPSTPFTMAPPAALPALFYGDTLIEEKIIRSDTVVRAKMTTFSSEIITKDDGKHTIALKFNLNVNEYLKGSGASSIVAVWVHGRSWDTNNEARDTKTDVLAERDSQWDDREAIIFLNDEGTGFGTTLDEQLKRADYYIIYVGDPFSPDDRYSIRSKENKMWLPAASGVFVSESTPAGDNKEFLLDVPPQAMGASRANSTSSPSTITLGSLKQRIKEVTAEFEGGDGSAAYKKCVTEKYAFKREIRYFKDVKGADAYDKSPQASALDSGLPANTALYQRQAFGYYPDTKPRTWLEGRDAALFTIVQGKITPDDYDGDGTLTAGVDQISYTESFITARPLPAGKYLIDRKEVWIPYLACNYTLSHDWTVTVTSPIGTIHEAFFDPVKMTGGGIGTDTDNGVLKPASFTANGAAANIERIEWMSSGRVEMDLKPGVSLAGHIIEFIGLDGSIILSLDFNETLPESGLSWRACDQPWKAGDLLMVRISDKGASTADSANPDNPCPKTDTRSATPSP